MALGALPVQELSSKEIAATMEADIEFRSRDLHDRADVRPTLAILSDNYVEETPTQKYIDLKEKVGTRLVITLVTEVASSPERMAERIEHYNQQPDIHGMIVQLPLVSLEHLDHEERAAKTDAILDTIQSEKDVDGLGTESPFRPATPLGIISLLEGNRIDYLDSTVLVRGLGRLVGKPLLSIMQERGARFLTSIDADTPEDEKRRLLNGAQVIISATGQAGGLTPELFDDIHPKVIVDAGTAEQKGVVVGDVSDALRDFGREHGWTFTPKKGGAGRLTVLNLLSHVVSAAEESAPLAVPTQTRDWRFFFQQRNAAVSS